MNIVILSGRLGSDPAMKDLSNGTKVCSFSLATDDGTKERPLTSWHQITCWNGLATTCGNYLKKGQKITLRGELTYDEYTNNAGQKVKQAIITAFSIEFGEKNSNNEPF